MSSTSSSVFRVVHLAQSDREGGANRAAFRLHRALRRSGLNSVFHPGRKLGDDPDALPAWPRPFGRFRSDLAAYLNALTVRAYRHRPAAAFSPVRVAYGRLDRKLLASADVVCLHWIAGAFLKPAALAGIGRPLVWRLSDLWPFTGGCHYSGGCHRFESVCGQCPALASHSAFDLARLDFRARQKAYCGLDLTIVAPSRWIAGEARRSSLFRDRRIEHIATGVDLGIYRPSHPIEARKALGLPVDRRIVLFGALAATEDRRKGYHHMKAALAALSASGEAANVVGVVFGGRREASLDETLGLPTLHVGRFDDEARLALLYAAADVLVAPFEEDNLPNVILEALACGTPVVAFSAGGIPDAVDHGENGYLAPAGDAEELARGVQWVLGDAERHDRLRRGARATAEARFDLRVCAERYRGLFAQIAGRPRSAGA